MDKDKINKGNKITKTFQGGIYEELMYLRQSIWAMYVQAHQTDFTQEDIDKANTIIQDMLTLNDTIESMRNQ